MLLFGQPVCRAMKTAILFPLLSACCLSVPGQSFVSSTIRAHRAVPIGPHETRVEVQRDALDENGEPTQVTTSYIRLATGLNRWDDTQKSWVAAVPEFEETEDGYFVARKTRTQLILPPDISAEPVDMLGPDGVRLISAPIGVAVVDLSTGGTALLGSLTSCRAEQVAPDTIVFRNCLAGGIRGDLIFHISLSGMEQFLVLREWIPSLADLEMEPAHVRVQLYTEFFDAPEPTGDAVILKRADGSTLAQRAWEPDLTDRELVFGESTRMIPGRAFAAGEQNLDAPVAKSYEAIGKRRVLVESCDYVDVAAWLEQLPVPDGAGGYKGVGLERGKLIPSNLPEREAAKPRWASLPYEERFRDEAFAALNPETLKAQDTGSYLASSGPGLVLDYTISGTLPNYTLRGDTTYEVTAPVFLTETTTLEGGAVIKFPLGSAAMLVEGPFLCKTSAYRPAVFTAKDDDTVGEILEGSTGTVGIGYYGSYQLYFYNTGEAVDVHDVQLKHGYNGLVFTGAFTHSVRHVQLIDCRYPLYLGGSMTLNAQNVLIENVKPSGRAVQGNASAVVNAQHLTVANVPALYYGLSPANCTLWNSLIVDASSIQDYTRRGEDDNVETTGVSTVFESVGAGHHYLPAGSPYRNAGTDQIDADLLADLRTLTTSPPVVYENLTLSIPMEWRPRVDRDSAAATWGRPDLGYHYPPIDYAVSDLTVVQGGNLSVTPGVVIGVFGNHGIIAEDYAQVSLVGSALDRITVAHYTAIQEQSEAWGSSQFSPTMIYGPPHNVISGHESPDVELRFVDTSVMGGRGNGVFFLNNWAAPKTLVARDCRFFGGYTYFAGHWDVPAQVEVCNNLFRRSENKFYGWMNLTAYNNLFFGGNSNQFSCYITQPNTWTVKDNVFQDTCIGGSASYIARGHNAYLGTVSPVPTGWGAAGDVTFSSFAYASGPLGEFYQADTGLTDQGSRTPADAQLYHYTAASDGVKEGLDAVPHVDIGMHYVATEVSTITGQPMANDTDQDGKPDYREDANNNGSIETGETDPSLADSDGDGMEDGQDPALTADHDHDGLPDADEATYGMDPDNPDTNGNGLPDGAEYPIAPTVDILLDSYEFCGNRDLVPSPRDNVFPDTWMLLEWKHSTGGCLEAGALMHECYEGQNPPPDPSSILTLDKVATWPANGEGEETETRTTVGSPTTPSTTTVPRPPPSIPWEFCSGLSFPLPPAPAGNYYRYADTHLYIEDNSTTWPKSKRSVLLTYTAVDLTNGQSLTPWAAYPELGEPTTLSTTGSRIDPVPPNSMSIDGRPANRELELNTPSLPLAKIMVQVPTTKAIDVTPTVANISWYAFPGYADPPRKSVTLTWAVNCLNEYGMHLGQHLQEVFDSAALLLSTDHDGDNSTDPDNDDVGCYMEFFILQAKKSMWGADFWLTDPAYETIDAQGEFDTLLQARFANIKVVSRIAPDGVEMCGFAQPNTAMIVGKKYLHPVVLAHEYMHISGLLHRGWIGNPGSSTDAIMCDERALTEDFTEFAKHREVNHRERDTLYEFTPGVWWFNPDE